MRRSSTAQKQHEPRKVLGLANAPAGLALEQRRHRLVEPECRHAARKHAGADAVDCDVERHQFARLQFRQVDAGRLGRAVAEGARAGRGQAAVGACGDVGGLDAGHAGDVDDAGRVVRSGTFEQKRFQAGGRVEDGFDVQGHQLVPAGLGEVVVWGAPACMAP